MRFKSSAPPRTRSSSATSCTTRASPVPSDQSWIFIGDAHFAQQPLGLLGVWDTRSVPDGAYALRVRVVKADGNYIDSDTRRVIVANTRPPETPTPEVPLTPLPELPPTEAPAPEGAAVVEAPTGVVEIPTISPTATREVTPGPEAEVTPFTSTTAGSTTGGSSGSAAGSESGTSITDQVFSTDRLLETARKAATYTLAAFLAVGAFFGVKAILVWLWYKIKP